MLVAYCATHSATIAGFFKRLTPCWSVGVTGCLGVRNRLAYYDTPRTTYVKNICSIVQQRNNKFSDLKLYIQGNLTEGEGSVQLTSLY
jgi:hypothetical protein